MKHGREQKEIVTIDERYLDVVIPGEFLNLNQNLSDVLVAQCVGVKIGASAERAAELAGRQR